MLFIYALCNISVITESMQTEEEKFQHERVRYLNRGCIKLVGKFDWLSYSDQMIHNWTLNHLRWSLLVNETNHFMYCYIPKVASTTWKKTVIGDVDPHNDLLSRYVYDVPISKMNKYGFKQLINYSWVDIEKQGLSSYYRSLTVRHPQERLLSTFIEKFEKPTELNFDQFYGKRVYGRLGLESKPGQRYNVSFGQFVDYVLALYDIGYADEHWAPYWYICQPCLFEYDFIGKFETYTSDMNYLFKKVLGHHPYLYSRYFGPHIKHTDLKAQIESYYNQVSADHMKRLEHMYMPDLQLFNYQFHYYSNHEDKLPSDSKDFIFKPVTEFYVTV